MNVSDMVFAMLAAAAIGGALFCVLAKELVRFVAGLGVFLLALAGFFLYYRMSFLAAAEVFVYIGGVLVLMVLAIMLVHRRVDGSRAVETRHNIGAASVSIGVFLLVVMALRDVMPESAARAVTSGPSGAAEALLGPMLTHFEIAGVLLLAALVAVVVISGGEGE